MNGYDHDRSSAERDGEIVSTLECGVLAGAPHSEGDCQGQAKLVVEAAPLRVIFFPKRFPTAAPRPTVIPPLATNTIGSTLASAAMPTLDFAP